MAFKHYLIFILSFLLLGCAQVGKISGGPEDTIAPKPIAEKTKPKNGTTFFSGKEVEITFDEFVRLSEANLNIVMVPPHATIQSRLKKRTLQLKWEEDLQPNTTYAIYLNNAVKDITEGNDTILKYVFSTGADIDSLYYTVSVSDAWSGRAVEKAIVGLFDSESMELLSFAETNVQGQASFSYLKPRDYSVISFLDGNRDLAPQPHEAVAFSSGSLTLDSSIVDSIPLRLFYPVDEPKITEQRYKPPGQVILRSNVSVEGADVFVNGRPIENDQLERVGHDSLHLFVNTKNNSSTEVVVRTSEINDTVVFRYSDKEKSAGIKLKPCFSSGSVSPWDSVSFFTNDLITKVNLNKIIISRTKDSSLIEKFSVRQEYNKLYIHFYDRDSLEKVNISFQQGAIVTAHGENVEYTGSCTLLPEKKFGSVSLDLSHYQNSSIILLLIQSGKIIREIAMTPTSEPYLIKGIPSGAYSFRVIHDANENERWDIGNRSENIQPEQIDYFSTTTNVRANWEVEATLIPYSQ